MRSRFITPILLLIATVPASAQFGRISEKDELNAGNNADIQITKQYRVSESPERNRLVQSLGRKLTAVCERPDLKWTFRALDSKELNAFSVPGCVYVTTATMDACGNDAVKLTYCGRMAGCDLIAMALYVS